MDADEAIYVVARARRGDSDYFREASMEVLQNGRDSQDYSVLAWAVMDGHLECTRVIAKRCPSLVYFQNFEGSTVLHNAAWRSNTKITKFLISLSGKLESGNHEDIELDSLFAKVKLTKSKALTTVDHDGHTPLHWAVWNEQLDTVKLLIEADPDVEYGANTYGETPLLMAMRQDQSSSHVGASTSAKIRKLILKMQPTQARLRIGDNMWAPIHHAAYRGDVNAIEDIIRFCPDSWDGIDNSGRNILHLAAEVDNDKVVKYILGRHDIAPTLLNEKDGNGNTPLHAAAIKGNQNTVLCLIYDPRVDKMTMNKQGINVLDSITVDYDKRKAGVCSAVEYAQRGVVDYFKAVALDVLMQSKDELGDSVLSVAVLENYLDCCEVIHKRCPALLYSQNNEGYTALHHAACRGKVNTINFLISVATTTYSADQENLLHHNLLTMVDHQGATALHLAVAGLQLGAVKLLIEADLDNELLGMSTVKKSTALHWAVEKQNLEIVKLLVEADPHLEHCADETGETPLLLAMRLAQLQGNAGASATIRKLSLKMQPNQCKSPIGDNGWTPLHHAACKGDLHAIEDIIQFCPGCWEEVDNEGRNFLHIAVMYEHIRVVKYVLGTKEIAASVLNGQGKDGKTPLHIAALGGNESLTLCLLYDPRVNKTTTNSEGKNVLDSITFDYDKRKAGVFGVSDRLDQKDLKDQSDFDLVVGALIATVSFTAGLTVPGGYNSDGPEKGMAVFSKEISFEAFVISNDFALIFSLYAVFSHFCTRRFHKKEDIIYQLNVATFCTLGAILAMMVAFITGSYVVLANSHRLALIVSVNSCFFFIFACRPLWKMVLQHRRSRRWICLGKAERNGDCMV